MIYAPVAIPTLNRTEKLRNCLDSLAECNWADRTDVFVALDYPPSEKYKEGFEQTRDFLMDAKYPFKSFTVIERKENLGPANNLQSLLEEKIWPCYDRVIRSEDDNIFAKTFLQFMDTALERYEKDERILSVGGFAIPARWKDDGVDDAVLLNSNMNTWGFGIWIDRERKIRDLAFKPDYYHEILDSKERTRRLLSGSDNDCGAMAWYVMNGNYGANDTFRSVYARDMGLYGVYPKKSKVYNDGLDGSGQNSGSIDIYGMSTVALDPADDLPPDVFPDDLLFHEKETFAAINAIYRQPWWKKAFTRFVFATHSFWLNHTNLGSSLRKLYIRINPRL